MKQPKAPCLNCEDRQVRWYEILGIEDVVDDFAPTIIEAERQVMPSEE